MATWNPKANDIFLDAVELRDPAERRAFLDRLCGPDAELRALVESLLAAGDRPATFLDHPAVAPLASTGDLTSARTPLWWFNSATAEDSADAEPGTVIAGRYTLVERIGEGGMGEVWVADQTHPVSRKVAVKLIKAGMDSRAVLARFDAERQALALMDHPNIAKVLDGGLTDRGRPFFVMELVNGLALTEFCDRTRLPVRDRLGLFVQVCQAVQHAHQKGVIHRDLKPSNVLVTLYDGRPVPKVIDFGVAKATGGKLTDETVSTAFGAVVGTLEYMAPEQAGFSALDVDTRADVYSLGVILYELLTGVRPYDSARIKRSALDEVLRIIREEEPPKPSTRLSESTDTLPSVSAQRQTEPAKLRKLVRGELDWIVMKALEKERVRRYETANAFATDVQRYLADEAVQACPPSAGYRLRKFTRRNKGMLATAGVVAVALVIATTVSTWQAIRATDAERETAKQLKLKQAAEEKETRRLYRSLVDQARASRLSRRVGQRFKTLEVLAEATRMARDLKLGEPDFLELRNETIACLALPDLRVAKEWDGFPDGSCHVDFAGAAGPYARTDRRGAVSVRRVADDVEICRLAGTGAGVTWPNFSPDGRFLLHQGARSELWQVTGPEPVRILKKDSWGAFAFSADSRQFARASPDGTLELYDLPTGRKVKQLEGGPRPVGPMAFHPKDRQIAIGHANGVQIRDLETGRVLAELGQRLQDAGRSNLTWRPDGKLLAVVGSDRIIQIWDVAARKPIARLEGHKNHGIELSFDHAGDLLVSGDWDGILRLWDPRTGRQLFQTHMRTGPLHLSPDDRFLAADSTGKKLLIFEIATPLGYRTLVREPVRGNGEYYSAAVHPDGRLLAVGMRNEAGLWDLVTGDYLAAIPLGLGVAYVDFEPSGALLTGASDGFRRWPVQADPDSAERRRLGPPEKLPLPGSDCWFRCSRDGRVLASAQYDGGVVLHADRPGQPIPLRPHEDVRYIAVSPDGRLVATGSHNGTKVKVWDARSGKPEKELPVEFGSWVDFSPDGKWLGTSGGGCRLWAVDGWQPGPEIGGTSFAFSPDSKLLAVETGRGAVRLVDPDSGREYARLDDPNQDRAAMTFSPDGSRLVTFSNDNNAVHVWDLRAIRAELAKLDLDWGLPPYPPPWGIDRRPPLQVQIDLPQPKPPAAKP